MKKSCIALLLVSLSFNLYAQVKFNLVYQPEVQTYTVSLMPETSFPQPKNMIGSAQFVLRARFNENFTPIVTSLVEGVVWADNAYVDFPAKNPEYTYVSIALANGPTKKIPLTSGEEIPLFSFKNAGGDCAGLIELVSNEDPAVQEVLASGYNVTQHLGVLGARGNAYTGILNGSATCALSQVKALNDRIIGAVQIAPVPANRKVTISWQNMVDIRQRVEMVICDSRSREVFREKMSGAKGESALNIDVSNWASGVYNVRFQFDSGGQTRGWHFMVAR